MHASRLSSSSSVGHGVPGLKNRADRQSRMNNNNFSFCSALLAARTNSFGLYPGSPSSLSTSQQCDGSKFWTLASSSFPPKPTRMQQLALELAADFSHVAGLVWPSEAALRRRRRSQSGDPTSNPLSSTYNSGMDQVGRMELEDAAFPAGAQASLRRLLFGHPFHNLLPPRHPMPPCLDTLPPALGAPHN